MGHRMKDSFKWELSIGYEPLNFKWELSFSYGPFNIFSGHRTWRGWGCHESISNWSYNFALCGFSVKFKQMDLTNANFVVEEVCKSIGKVGNQKFVLHLFRKNSLIFKGRNYFSAL